MSGSAMIYGDSGHSGRVDVAYRPLGRLEAIVLPHEDHAGVPLDVSGALGIVEAPATQAWVVQLMGKVVIVLPHGVYALSGASNTLRLIATTPDGLVWGDEFIPWHDPVAIASLDGVGFLDDIAAQLGLQLCDRALTFVAQVLPTRGQPRVVVRCVSHEVPGQGLRTRHRIELPGYGTGTIDSAGRAVVAMADGTVIGFDTTAEEGDVRRSRERFRLQRDPAPYALTALPSGLAWVAANSERDRASPNVRQLRRLLDPRLDHEGEWSSIIERLDDMGSTLWRTQVDFAVHQPPIDGGGGKRLYVVGHGIAALDEGRIAWWWPWTTRVHATAFNDGCLAICAGPHLRVLDPNGKSLSALRTPGDEPIGTPPAILKDGSIAFGTHTKLYVARPH